MTLSYLHELNVIAIRALSAATQSEAIRAAVSTFALTFDEAGAPLARLSQLHFVDDAVALKARADWVFCLAHFSFSNRLTLMNDGNSTANR